MDWLISAGQAHLRGIMREWVAYDVSIQVPPVFRYGAKSVYLLTTFSGGGNRAEWEKADPAVLNEKLKVLWLGCGTEDFAYNGVSGMHELLTKKNVKHVWNPSGGGHSWPNWQVYLSKYAPLLFRD